MKRKRASRFEKSFWGLPMNRNGWLLCRTKKELHHAANLATCPDWEEAFGRKPSLPLLVNWIYNENDDPEFVTVDVTDAKDLLSAT